MKIIGEILITLGVFFSFVSGLGILRMPDILNRLQAGTKASTLGLLSVVLGTIILWPSQWFKLILIGIFIVATNPISSHNLARASYKNKLEEINLKEDMMNKEEVK